MGYMISVLVATTEKARIYVSNIDDKTAERIADEIIDEGEILTPNEAATYFECKGYKVDKITEEGKEVRDIVVESIEEY